MQIYTSYFYQIRNFKPYMIPVSTALSDPIWYRPPHGEFFIDKRGVINGLRYEPLIVQGHCQHQCPCYEKNVNKCVWLQEYRKLLSALDINIITKAFEHCQEFVAKKLGLQQEPVIVLMVYETPQNPCSERIALQDFFTLRGYPCKELTYPI